MKTFDWDFAFAQTHNPAKIDWLKKMYAEPVTIEAFIAVWSSLPRFGRHPNKKYSPSASRMQYNRLKKNFGFFQ